VSWPTPPSTAVAPVGPTTPVKPVQGSGRDPQADVEARREARLPAPKAGAPRVPDADTSDTPPLLPRDAGAAVPGQTDARARQEAAAQRAEQAIKKAEADKAGHRKAMERLQDVLSSMWAASGAVVDQALGLATGRSDLPGNQSDTAPDLSAVAASTISRRLLPQAPPQAPDTPEQPLPQGMSWPVMPPAAEEPASLAAPEVPGGEVIAYDEHGNSSLAPLEAGSIISERV
jgi:hypothetical protein